MRILKELILQFLLLVFVAWAIGIFMVPVHAEEKCDVLWGALDSIYAKTVNGTQYELEIYSEQIFGGTLCPHGLAMVKWHETLEDPGGNWDRDLSVTLGYDGHHAGIQYFDFYILDEDNHRISDEPDLRLCCVRPDGCYVCEGPPEFIKFIGKIEGMD